VIFIEYDSAHGGAALSKWPAYLTCAFPELGGLGLREMLARILAKCIYNRMFGAAQYDSYEYWCGVGNITLEAVLLGANALRFDKLLAREHDSSSQFRGPIQWGSDEWGSYISLHKFT
jgi:hypothetical protein